jgi:DNA helicase-2/ATP-dependent DNA helicase PcrA
LTFNPSHYQTDIFSWIEGGAGSAQVGAVAGSGKTTTLVEAATRMNGAQAVFVAFNKHIAETLASRLGRGCEARTLHSIGREIIADAYGRLEVDTRKYWEAYDTFGRKLKPEEKTAFPKLVEFAQLTCARTEAELNQAATDFNLYLTPAMVKPAFETLAWGLDQAKHGLINFNDMVWIPAELGLQPYKRFDFVLADEAQDFNVAQRRLVLSLMKDGGRLLAVGDENQAIMQFAGADVRSWRAIAEETRAQLLPLSICYRCPTTHLELARQLVPQIEARDGAPRGVLEYRKKAELPAMVRTGDLILCRRTAPLIPQAFHLIARGINARVRGRDIGKGLAQTVRRIAKTPAAWDNFAGNVSKWLDGQVSRLTLKGASDDAILQARDQAECMVICKNNFDASSGAELATQIERIFSDDDAPITLSTIHRAKGLEAERVFILEYEKLGVARKAQESIAEANLKYVALTRSRAELYLIESESTGAGANWNAY